jgi:hypothetical protein
MGRDTHLTDKETGDVYSFDNILTQGWLRGHSGGLDQCVGWLHEKAIELFKRGERTEAGRMQDLANEMKGALEPRMRERAREHEEQHRYIVKSGRKKQET